MSVNSIMTALANAVRAKAGGSSKLTIPQMTAAVQGIAGERPRCVNERSVDVSQSNYDGAAEAVKCAMGYWAAKNSGTRVFQY